MLENLFPFNVLFYFQFVELVPFFGAIVKDWYFVFVSWQMMPSNSDRVQSLNVVAYFTS